MARLFYWRSAVLTACILFLAFTPSATPQTPQQDELWRELRKRIDEGREVESLLPRLSPPPRPRSSPAVPASLPPSILSKARIDSPKLKVVRTACALSVPPALALALIEHESGFRNDARGIYGEIGAAQILPSTATQYGYSRQKLAADFDYNIQAGMEILASLLKLFPGDEPSAVRAYNGGPGWRSSSPEARRMTAVYASGVQARKEKYSSVRCD